MTATIMLFSGAGLIALFQHSFLIGAALMLFILILGVQWMCIAPPGVDEKDIP